MSKRRYYSFNEDRYNQILRDLPSIKHSYLIENKTLDEITKLYTNEEEVDIAYRGALYRILRKEGIIKPKSLTKQAISKKLTGSRYKPRNHLD